MIRRFAGRGQAGRLARERPGSVWERPGSVWERPGSVWERTGSVWEGPGSVLEASSGRLAATQADWLAGCTLQKTFKNTWICSRMKKYMQSTRQAYTRHIPKTSENANTFDKNDQARAKHSANTLHA